MNLRTVALSVLSVVVLGMWTLTCVAARYDDIAAGVRALDPRTFEELTLVAAGTGGAYENPNRLGPALVVGSGERLALGTAAAAYKSAIIFAARAEKDKTSPDPSAVIWP